MPSEEDVLLALANERTWINEGAPSPDETPQLVTYTITDWKDLQELGVIPTRALAVVLPGQVLFGSDLAGLEGWDNIVASNPPYVFLRVRNSSGVRTSVALFRRDTEPTEYARKSLGYVTGPSGIKRGSIGIQAALATSSISPRAAHRGD